MTTILTSSNLLGIVKENAARGSPKSFINNNKQ